MFSGIRAAVFWLILIALPLHGLAGGAMPQCGEMPMPMSHQFDRAIGLGVTGSSLSADSVAQSDVDPASFECGGMSSADASSKSSIGGSCVVLMACGIVAASASQTAGAVPMLPRVVPSALQSSLEVGFLTDAPDRPPRSLS